jgi:CRISPR-associated protein Cas6
MLWEEEVESLIPENSGDMIDLAFAIECRCLPLDHAYALSQAVQQALPWFAEETRAGLHRIHGAESGNGWYRPEGEDDLFYPSRRTRLTLRLPKSRLAEAAGLSGQTLDIAGYPLKIGQATEKKLARAPVLFARHILADPLLSENDFIELMRIQLSQLGIRCRKMLCGRSAAFTTPEGKLFTRSLMIADLKPEDGLALQQHGLGEGRKLGCGLFVQHKDIAPVSAARQDD